MKKNSHLVLFILVLFSIKTTAQVLRPGDGINLSFLNITDKIKGQYYIQDNGNIQLPYLGLVNTVGRDFAAIRNQIVKEYSKIYRNPEINIQPLFRIDVLGEVGKPGVYYATGYETFTDILAKAGGETNDADIDGIFILRNESKMEIDLEAIFESGNTFSDIGLQSGDKIYVPRTFWVNARDASILVSGVAVLVGIVSLFTK
ncbi:MAG: polysaccharide biosynthesis/export family protein [Melioribacteraceae bacterium]